MLVSTSSLRHAVSWVSCALLLVGCGPSAQQERCYDVVTRDAEPPPPLEVRVCGHTLPIDRQYPEYEDVWIARIEREKVDDRCPMCAEDLDPLFWQSFREEIERVGLASDEDPDCIDQGYAIELACRIGDDVVDTCVYEALLVSNCTLAGDYTP